jgi:TBC1 domain family protein 5
VERCLQENYFFREPSTKAKLLDILFIFSKLNPDLGYRQGMHELLAPIIWVVENDAIDGKSLNGHDTQERDALMVRALDRRFVEHDSFTIFCAVMQTAKSFYEHSDMNLSPSQLDVPPIVVRSNHIHQEVLKAVDPELADHLETAEVLPQIFLTYAPPFLQTLPILILVIAVGSVCCLDVNFHLKKLFLSGICYLRRN